MPSASTLIGELESAMRHGSGAQRAKILQRVTQLFLNHADAHRQEHVALFDDVMSRLIEQIEQEALIRLSTQLAPVANAPPKVVRELASSDSIEVAGPVLRQSPALPDDLLVELARRKGQDHLAAMAGRTHVPEKLTEVIVERGNPQVTLQIAGNPGARFSRKAFLQVADRANADSNLADKIVNRGDIPPDVFEHLLSKATDVVRQRLLKSANPDMRAKINQTLATIARQVSNLDHPRIAADRHPVLASVDDDPVRLRSELHAAARTGDRARMIGTLASLSKMPSETIIGLLRAQAEDGLLILCKSIGLSWPDAKSVFAVMTGAGSDIDQKSTFERYCGLSEDTALRVIRFVKSCKAVSKADLQRML